MRLFCKHVLIFMELESKGGIFPLAGSGVPSQVVARITEMMSDPTEMIILGSFGAALVLIVVSVLVRGGWMGRVGAEAAVERGSEGSPYGPPAVEAVPPDLPVGRVPVWFYRPADLMGAGFVFLVFCGLFLMSLEVPKDEPLVLNAGTLVVSIGFQIVMAGLVVFFVKKRGSVAEWLGLRWSGWPWVFLIAPGTVGFMWLVFGGLQVSGYVEWMESLGVETVQDTVKLLQESKDPVILGLMAAAAVVVAPVCEEIVFRGYFYGVLKKFAGVWPAVVASAIVFAGAHGSLTAMLPLFIFGGVLVFVYEKTGSIWAPMAVHFCFNGATVAAQMVARIYDIPMPR